MSPLYSPQNPRLIPAACLIILLGLVEVGIVWRIHSLGDTAAAEELAVAASATPSPSPTLTPSPSPISTPSPTAVSTPATLYLADRKAAIEAVLAQYSTDRWGLQLMDLSDGEQLSLNGDSTFTAASTTKLITACAYLQQVQAGNFSLDDQLGDYSAEFQLEQLVNQSNNDSWDEFYGLLGLDEISQYAKSIGLTQFDINANTDSPADLALLLRKLYTGELLNSTYTTQLLSYMQDTEEERFLPSGISSQTTLYHKIGLLGDNVHDVGIIVLPGRTLVAAIYSNGNGSADYDNRASAFTSIGKLLTN